VKNGKAPDLAAHIIIIWGATAKLAAENDLIQEKIKQAIHVEVNVSACKACADQLGVSDKLVKLGVEVKYWGEPMTEIWSWCPNIHIGRTWREIGCAMRGKNREWRSK